MKQDWKRKLRGLKRLEVRIRYEGERPSGAPLVWDDFFREGKGGAPRFPLCALMAMSREEYDEVLDAYFFRMYEALYEELGMGSGRAFELQLLEELGLPLDADEEAVRKRFHELLIAHHPDTGGNPDTLIEILEKYRALFR